MKQPWESFRMETARELLEECGLEGALKAEVFARTALHVFAFTRMLHRAGKPEFFCLARLPFTAEGVHSALPTGHEMKFTENSEGADTQKININKNIRSELIRVCSHFSQAGNDKMNTQALSLSYPLHHALDLLSAALGSESQNAYDLADFLAVGFTAK